MTESATKMMPHPASAANAAKLFAPNEELLHIWANFTEKSDEKCFTKFVKVSSSYPAKKKDLCLYPFFKTRL